MFTYVVTSPITTTNNNYNYFISNGYIKEFEGTVRHNVYQYFVNTETHWHC